MAAKLLGSARWLLDFYLRLGAHTLRRTFYLSTFGGVVLVYLPYAYFSGGTDLPRSTFDDVLHVLFIVPPILWLPVAYGYWSGKEREPLDPAHTTHGPYAGFIAAAGFMVVGAAKYFGWW